MSVESGCSLTPKERTGLALLGFRVAPLVLLPGWFVARAAKAAWTKRGSFAFRTLSPRHVLGAAGLLLLLDLATITGTIEALLGRSGRPSS